MTEYDKSKFYVDFSERDELSAEEKKSLEDIQSMYRPVERVDYLIEFRVNGKITDDEFETMTSIPYAYAL